LPAHFEELPVPEKNPMNEAKVELGAKLFYDPILSKDSSVSCSSCHFPHLSFSDGLAKSFGLNDSISMRNSPVLVNLAYANSYMMDGGIPSLELQVAAPILHEGEMGFDLFAIAEKLQQNDLYQQLSEEAFSRPIDAGAIAYSLAAFERSLLSYESIYDQYLEGDENALGTLAKRGMELFFSDSLNCTACHSGVNFTDYEFYSIGLYTEYTDQGRWRITEKTEDEGKFKTPTLRNIGLSAPYMHDGSIADLMGVIEFKMSGGNDHSNKSDKLKDFYLNEGDKLALLAFLESLDDAAFVEREITRKETL
jgi:cytochrome c peroxidase